MATAGPPGVAICTRVLASGKFKGIHQARLYFWRGQHYLQMNDLDAALADFEQAIKVDATEAGLFAARGFVNLTKGDVDRSLVDFNRAIAMQPGQQKLYLNRGAIWLGKKEYERANADFNEAIRLAPRTASAYYAMVSRAQIYREQGDLAKATTELDNAIKQEPKRSDAYLSRGVAARAKGDLERAMADFGTAIAIEPGATGLTGRGVVREALGDIAGAMADYARAIDMNSHMNKAADFNFSDLRSKETARTRLALLKENPEAAKAASAGASSPAPAEAARPASASPAPASKQIRRALVIGNGAYAAVTPLTNPARDAKSIAANLRGMGFEVSEGTDLDGASMKRAVNEFLIKAATAQMALVFYAGHGMQIDGKNFLVPIDAGAGGSDLKAGMIELDTILAGLDDQIRTNIVILDACRDNPLIANANVVAASRSMNVRSGLAAPSGLGAGATLGGGTLLAFATAPGAVALDGDGQNSPFSIALSRHITTPGLEVQAMLTRVRAEVVAATAKKQVPWSNSSLLGEVFLVGGR
jgi:tetratricopeptide (TPR) repeat protein